MGTAKKPGPQGTGFLLRILPYIEGDTRQQGLELERRR